MIELFNIEWEEKSIICAFHEANINLAKNTGIIICQPLAHEYIRCYGAHVKLAKELSNIGFHTMRFDYSGMGDSSGDFDNYIWDNWLDNLNKVHKLFIESYGIEDFIIIGTRLGGNLAAQFAAEIKAKYLVLLAPIKTGIDYFQELKKDYLEWLNGSFVKKGSIEKTHGREYYGFLYKQKLIEQIEELDLNVTLKQLPLNCTLFLIDDKMEEYYKKGNVIFSSLINHKFWIKKDKENSKNLVPIQEIELITQWLRNIK